MRTKNTVITLFVLGALVIFWWSAFLSPQSSTLKRAGGDAAKSVQQ